MEKVSKQTDDLMDILQEALNNKFTSRERRRIDVFHDRINIACPICGDSHDNDNKKRGNIYFESNTYKCFNCGIRYSLKDFLFQLKTIDLTDGSIPTNLLLQANYQPNSFAAEQNISFVFDSLKDVIEKYGVDRKKFARKLGLEEIDGGPKESYMKARCFRTYENFLWSDHNKKLFILNLDLKTEKVISFQVRNFQKDSKAKYQTYKLNKMYEELRMDIPEEEDFQQLDDISIYFNITNVDISKPLTYFEGPIDAYLYKNSVALASLYNKVPFETDNTRFLFDFDDDGSKKLKAYLKENKTVFLWRKFIKDYNIDYLEGFKLDFNDLLIQLRKKREYKVNFGKYFSNNPLDIIWL